MNDFIGSLLADNDPSVRYRTRTEVLGEDPECAELQSLRAEIRCSDRVKTLLSERGEDGTIPLHPYDKWRGAHWVLYLLAELAYPPGDAGLLPLREQAYGWLKPNEASNKSALNGRVRHCASLEGNALYYLVSLGLADERTHPLADRLLAWQWPDGGWNCDRHPEACHSSFNETLLPLRGLAAYADWSGRDEIRDRIEQIAEVFLCRSLFRRLSTGAVIRTDFVKLHFPAYWHYDVLGGLRAMRTAGFLCDPRCAEALDLLEAKRLPNGGFPVEKRYEQVRQGGPLGCSPVRWEPGGATRANPFVSVAALAVLKAAGRLPHP